MATGDLNNNVARLLRELKQVKYSAPVDEAGLRIGDPSAFLPLLDFALLRFSRHVARHVMRSGYELQGKTDRRFVESTFKLFRDIFHIRTTITAAQFLEQGYAERKLLLVCDVIHGSKRLHNDEVRKEKLQAVKSTRQASGFVSFKGTTEASALLLVNQPKERRDFGKGNSKDREEASSPQELHEAHDDFPLTIVAHKGAEQNGWQVDCQGQDGPGTTFFPLLYPIDRDTFHSTGPHCKEHVHIDGAEVDTPEKGVSCEDTEAGYRWSSVCQPAADAKLWSSPGRAVAVHDGPEMSGWDKLSLAVTATDAQHSRSCPVDDGAAWYSVPIAHPPYSDMQHCTRSAQMLSAPGSAQVLETQLDSTAWGNGTAAHNTSTHGEAKFPGGGHDFELPHHLPRGWNYPPPTLTYAQHLIGEEEGTHGTVVAYQAPQWSSQSSSSTALLPGNSLCKTSPSPPLLCTDQLSTHPLNLRTEVPGALAYAEGSRWFPGSQVPTYNLPPTLLWAVTSHAEQPPAIKSAVTPLGPVVSDRGDQQHGVSSTSAQRAKVLKAPSLPYLQAETFTATLSDGPETTVPCGVCSEPLDTSQHGHNAVPMEANQDVCGRPQDVTQDAPYVAKQRCSSLKTVRGGGQGVLPRKSSIAAVDITAALLEPLTTSDPPTPVFHTDHLPQGQCGPHLANNSTQEEYSADEPMSIAKRAPYIWAHSSICPVMPKEVAEKSLAAEERHVARAHQCLGSQVHPWQSDFEQLLARLSDMEQRLGSAEEEAKGTRLSAQQTQDSLEARITLLEGKVRLLEGQLKVVQESQGGKMKDPGSDEPQGVTAQVDVADKSNRECQQLVMFELGPETGLDQTRPMQGKVSDEKHLTLIGMKDSSRRETSTLQRRSGVCVDRCIPDGEHPVGPRKTIGEVDPGAHVMDPGKSSGNRHQGRGTMNANRDTCSQRTWDVGHIAMLEHNKTLPCHSMKRPDVSCPSDTPAVEMGTSLLCSAKAGGPNNALAGSGSTLDLIHNLSSRYNEAQHFLKSLRRH